LADAFAERRLPSRFGEALFCPSFPRYWDANYLRADRAAAAAAQELAAEADDLHAKAGHAHRTIRVNDDAAGARLEPGLAALGYEATPHLVMVHRRPPDRPVDTAMVREVDEDLLAPLRERGIRSEPWGQDDEVVRELLAAERRLETVTSVRRLAAFDAGRPAAYCSLFSDGRTAQIEAVMTLPEHRGKGLGRAIVAAALDAACKAGHDLVFLVALERDWPRKLYEKLGFDVAGRYWLFRATPDSRLELALRLLLDATGASRVTLRQDVPAGFFPVTHEAVAPGVKSIKDGAGIDLRGQPVARVLAETRTQVVQHDCASAFDDPAFQRMREAYGGLASQIVTPVLDGGRLVGIVSLHQCGESRTWTEAEIALAAKTAERVGAILAGARR
jgi:GNAT superfamily N-acetyltransferase